MNRDVEPSIDLDFRKTAIFIAGVFVIVLGVVIGTRLSGDAIAMLVGVIAGIAAGIPTALLLIFVTRRRREEVEPEPYGDRRAQMTPPVIIVTPGNAPQSWPYHAGALPAQQLPPTGGPRRFRVMGLDEEDMEPPKGQQETTPWYQ
jgi:hypothetical protein